MASGDSPSPSPRRRRRDGVGQRPLALLGLGEGERHLGVTARRPLCGRLAAAAAASESCSPSSAATDRLRLVGLVRHRRRVAEDLRRLGDAVDEVRPGAGHRAREVELRRGRRADGRAHHVAGVEGRGLVELDDACVAPASRRRAPSASAWLRAARACRRRPALSARAHWRSDEPVTSSTPANEERHHEHVHADAADERAEHGPQGLSEHAAVGAHVGVAEEGGGALAAEEAEGVGGGRERQPGDDEGDAPGQAARAAGALRLTTSR